MKRYTSEKKEVGARAGTDDGFGETTLEHVSIRLEPLNREFEAFELEPDGFRVIAEFVKVLEPASDRP